MVREPEPPEYDEEMASEVEEGFQEAEEDEQLDQLEDESPNQSKKKGSKAQVEDDDDIFGQNNIT